MSTYYLDFSLQCGCRLSTHHGSEFPLYQKDFACLYDPRRFRSRRCGDSNVRDGMHGSMGSKVRDYAFCTSVRVYVTLQDIRACSTRIRRASHPAYRPRFMLSAHSVSIVHNELHRNFFNTNRVADLTSHAGNEGRPSMQYSSDCQSAR